MRISDWSSDVCSSDLLRAAQLAQAAPDAAATLAVARHRLIDPNQMGSLFKALALTPRGLAPPAGFEAQETDPLSSPLLKSIGSGSAGIAARFHSTLIRSSVPLMHNTGPPTDHAPN